MKYQVNGKEWTATQLLRAHRIIEVDKVKGTFTVRLYGDNVKEMPFETQRKANTIYQKWLYQHLDNAMALEYDGEDGALYLQTVLSNSDLKDLHYSCDLDVKGSSTPRHDRMLVVKKAQKIKGVLSK